MATVKSGFNMDSIKGWMESNRITEVECLFPDFTGNAALLHKSGNYLAKW